MKVITVKQPWAYLLCAGIKDIENRTWKLPEKYKNKWVLIHASADRKLNLMYLTSYQYIDFLEKIDIKTFKPVDQWSYSAIIGAVKYSDCIIKHPSIWAERVDDLDVLMRGFKQIYNWVVSEAVLFDKPILNVKGKLSFWDYPAEMIICPKCGKICLNNTDDGFRFTHECEHCGFWITESDYEILK